MKRYKETPFLEQNQEYPECIARLRKIGLSRNTVYRWCKEDLKFKERLDEAIITGTESVNDLAESKLIGHINSGNLRAIQYWLDNNKKNYARPRPKDFWESVQGDNRVTEIKITVAKPKKKLKSQIKWHPIRFQIRIA